MRYLESIKRCINLYPLATYKKQNSFSFFESLKLSAKHSTIRVSQYSLSFWYIILKFSLIFELASDIFINSHPFFFSILKISIINILFGNQFPLSLYSIFFKTANIVLNCAPLIYSCTLFGPIYKLALKKRSRSINLSSFSIWKIILP